MVDQPPTPPPTTKPLDVEVSILCFCPACKGSTQIGTADELELNEKNDYRAELAPEEATCRVCKTKVIRKKIVVTYLD